MVTITFKCIQTMCSMFPHTTPSADSTVAGISETWNLNLILASTVSITTPLNINHDNQGT